MFVFMGMGFVLRKYEFFSKETIKQLTGFVMYIIGSSVIINAFNRPVTDSLLSSFEMDFLCAIILLGSSILICHFVFKFERFSKNENVSDYKFQSVYSNCGFMGIPLIEALLGKEGMFYAIPYLAVFNLFLWSHGIGLFEANKSGKINWKKVFINPCIIASVLGFVLFMFGIIYRLPSVITKPIFYLANMNTPLSMIVIGANFVSITEPIYKDKKAWEITFIRNFAFPLIHVVILYFIPMPTNTKIAMLAMSAAPIAGVSVLFSVMFNKPVDFPSRALCLSTVVSVFSMPCVMFIGSFLL